MVEAAPNIATGFRIRNLAVAPGLVLAPMSGVTTTAFRRLIRELNPGAVGLVVSEFISVEGLTRGSVRSKEMLAFKECERPFGIQIFGFDPQRMRDGALMAQDAGADLVDINCGCPAPKVVRKGGGCELMRQPDHLREILREVRKAVSIPLTLKMRSGWDEQNRNASQIAAIAVNEGVEALTIHGRTRSQLYRGSADWSVVRSVAESVKVPVCGSGDVVDQASALERLREGVAGLFIGRAALANPFVFKDVISGTTTSLRNQPRLAISVIQRYIELLEESFRPQHCVGRVKQLVTQMGRGQPWRADMVRAHSLDEQRALLREAAAALEDGGVYRSKFEGGATVKEAELTCESYSSDADATEAAV